MPLSFCYVSICNTQKKCYIRSPIWICISRSRVFKFFCRFTLNVKLMSSMSTSDTTTTTLLRNRFDKSIPDQNEKTTEELLIEKLDKFLSSIESRLDSFEQYFKVSKGDIDEDLSVPEESDKSRRNSNASLSSIRSFSVNNLNMIYQRLGFIKDSVLKSSFTNLENLYNTLDDQYNYLFNSSTPIDDEKIGSNSKEMLSVKIITTIQYFDEKLLQVDNLIQDRTIQGTADYKAPTFKHLGFYNFNRALKAAENKYLHYYQLPLRWRENRYIVYGYRYSMKHLNMLKSVFKLNHNESMNIWTHLIGFLLFLYICFWHYPGTETFQRNSFQDNAAMYTFLAAAVGCLGCSVIFHTYTSFANIATKSNCACVDYTGITVLITASIMSAEYCSLYHYPSLLRIYMIFSSICGLTGFTFNWSPYFDKPECRSLRIGFYVGLAFLGFTTIICQIFYEGFVSSMKFFFPMVYKSLIWYAIGVIFYGSLFPERWRYDVVIIEDDTCNHAHNSSDILKGNPENSGNEELEQIENDIKQEAEQYNHYCDEDDCKSIDDEKDLVEEEENKYRDIIDKHFPLEPIKTPYNKDFFSLWWVDYCFSSHNIWHICVVLGVIGHYYTIIEMFDKIANL